MKNLLRFSYIGILATSVILTVALAQKPTARDQVATTLQSMIRIQATDTDSRTAHRIALQLQDWIWETGSARKIELIKADLAELNKLTLTGDLATLRTKLNTQIPVILPN